MSTVQMYICPNSESGCAQPDIRCRHRVPHSHSSGCNTAGEECAVCVPIKKTNKGVSTMINHAKTVATSIKTTIKPYEKYIGLVALAVVIDHFLLDGKYAHKFKELAEAIVKKITTGLSNLTTKLSDAWFTEDDSADGEDK